MSERNHSFEHIGKIELQDFGLCSLRFDAAGIVFEIQSSIESDAIEFRDKLASS